MYTKQITLEIPLTSKDLDRIDAAAKWMGSTQEDVLETLISVGIHSRIHVGLSSLERLMDKHTSHSAALAA